jgi:hypothetical protein
MAAPALELAETVAVGTRVKATMAPVEEAVLVAAAALQAMAAGSI